MLKCGTYVGILQYMKYLGNQFSFQLVVLTPLLSLMEKKIIIKSHPTILFPHILFHRVIQN